MLIEEKKMGMQEDLAEVVLMDGPDGRLDAVCIMAIRFICTHHAEIQRNAEDAARIDRLQELVDLEGELLLHNGKGSGSGFIGFGLKNLGRTLREAIDSDLSSMRQANTGNSA
jgi:hypothetical protein